MQVGGNALCRLENCSFQPPEDIRTVFSNTAGNGTFQLDLFISSNLPHKFPIKDREKFGEKSLQPISTL